MPNKNARELRKNLTDAEKKLWSKIRRKQLGNHRFRRQHPIGPFILDFYCSKAKLAIELDGGQHSEDDAIAYDKSRTEWLEQMGIKVIRFDNYEVLKNIDNVLISIYWSLEEE